MKEKDFKFSVDGGGFNLEEIRAASKLAENYFNTHEDKEQININDKYTQWILDNIPDYLNIIKFKGDVVGFNFILPSDNEMMDKFILKEINEAELFNRIMKKSEYSNPEAIYLCAVFIKDRFRRKGIVLEASVKSIKKVTGSNKIKPILFYWAYSKEGKRLAEKVSKIVGLTLKARK